MKPAAIAFAVFMSVCLAVVFVAQYLTIGSLIEEQSRLKKRMDKVMHMVDDAKEAVHKHKEESEQWNDIINKEIIKMKSRLDHFQYGEDISNDKRP